jgi:hypothetical protein
MGTLVVVFTSSVPVDLPLFAHVNNLGQEIGATARTTSGLTLSFKTAIAGSYEVSMMITT